MPISKTVVPWPGGKTRLLQHLLPLLSDNPHRTYVEAFAGGAAVLFNRPEPAKVEVLNDAHREIVTLYRVLANHLDEFMRQFRWMLTSRDEFQRLQRLPPDTLTLAEVMANLQGQAILTINDHPDMRRLFGRFKSKTVGISYTIGAGKPAARKERIYRTWT